MDCDWIPLHVSIHVLEINDLLAWDCRVKDHPHIQTEHKTQLWCSQDSARKQNSWNSTVPDIKNQDTMEMQQYNCNSSLIVACWKVNTLNGTNHVIFVQLQHHKDHIPYFDIEMPSIRHHLPKLRMKHASILGNTDISPVPKYVYKSGPPCMDWNEWDSVEKASVLAPICTNITECVPGQCLCVWYTCGGQHRAAVLGYENSGT